MSHDLAYHLANEGFRVVFVSHFPYFEKPQIIHLPKGQIVVCSWPTKNRPTQMVDFWWFTKLYFKYKPAVVLGHFVGSNITIVLSKIFSLGRVLAIDHYHTLSNAILTDLQKIGRKQRFLVFRKKIFYQLFCDYVFCPSEFAKTDLKNVFGYGRARVIVNPISDRYLNDKVYEHTHIIVSFLGRLEPTKGIIETIVAFQNYKAKNPETKLMMQIAGTGSLKNQILEMIKSSTDIVFHGGLEYVAIDQYLTNSHYTIIPSKFDNLPTVGLESLMLGRPLLISTGTGLTSFIIPEKSGFLFDFGVKQIEAAFDTAVQNFSKLNFHHIQRQKNRLRQNGAVVHNLCKQCQHVKALFHFVFLQQQFQTFQPLQRSVLIPRGALK